MIDDETVASAPQPKNHHFFSVHLPNSGAISRIDNHGRSEKMYGNIAKIVSEQMELHRLPQNLGTSPAYSRYSWVRLRPTSRGSQYTPSRAEFHRLEPMDSGFEFPLECLGF